MPTTGLGACQGPATPSIAVADGPGDPAIGSEPDSPGGGPAILVDRIEKVAGAAEVGLFILPRVGFDFPRVPRTAC